MKDSGSPGQNIKIFLSRSLTCQDYPGKRLVSHLADEEIHAAYEKLASAEEELRQNYEDLKRTEQELRGAKTHLEAINRASPDLIFVHAADGHIIDVNENVLRAFGFTREEAVSADPEDMIGRGYTAEMAMQYLQTALDEGEANFEWVSKRRNGEEFPVESACEGLSRKLKTERPSPASLLSSATLPNAGWRKKRSMRPGKNWVS